MPKILSQAAIEQYERDGFYFPIRALGADEVTNVRRDVEKVEREMIERTLQYTKNNRLQTARLLGISRRTLYNKLARYKLN